MISFVNIFFVYSNEIVLYQTYLNLFLKRIFKWIQCDAPWAAWCVWVCWPSGGNYCKREPTHTYTSLLWPHPIGLTLLIHPSWFYYCQPVCCSVWSNGSGFRCKATTWSTTTLLHCCSARSDGSDWTHGQGRKDLGNVGTSQFHNRYP